MHVIFMLTKEICFETFEYNGHITVPVVVDGPFTRLKCSDLDLMKKNGLSKNARVLTHSVCISFSTVFSSLKRCSLAIVFSPL